MARTGSITQAHHILVVNTAAAGFTDVTADVVRWLAEVEAGNGLLTLFIRHTSASLTIQENADPDVLRDLSDALDKLAPRNAGYRHDSEGPDDMPSHIKSMITATSLSVPVIEGEMVLGTWQAIYLIEHRDRPHRREIVLHFSGALGN